MLHCIKTHAQPTQQQRDVMDDQQSKAAARHQDLLVLHQRCPCSQPLRMHCCQAFIATQDGDAHQQSPEPQLPFLNASAHCCSSSWPLHVCIHSSTTCLHQACIVSSPCQLYRLCWDPQVAFTCTGMHAHQILCRQWALLCAVHRTAHCATNLC